MLQRLGCKWLLGTEGQEALLPVYYGKALCTETIFSFFTTRGHFLVGCYIHSLTGSRHSYLNDMFLKHNCK